MALGAAIPKTETGVPIGGGGTYATSNSDKKSKSDEGGEATLEKGKVVSSKIMCREIISRLVERSKQRYPLCSVG